MPYGAGPAAAGSASACRLQLACRQLPRARGYAASALPAPRHASPHPPPALPCRSHKRARCFERLLDMGFDPDLAGPATEAAGADAPAAAGLLTEGTLGEAAPKPIDVTT